jgi:hypothetical protein
MVIQYLKSKGVFRVPFIKICSLLWACIRHKAAHGGMKKPPNKGMVNDIEMIASLLPYCDAMYIDKGMAELLNHGEVKKGIAEYRTKIFSKVNKNDFLKFLDDMGTHLRRDTVIPQWFQASKAAAASDGHAVHCWVTAVICQLIII